MSTPGLYTDAHVFDILHAPGTKREVDGLERIARAAGLKYPLTWLEPACGTGRYLAQLAERGHRVIGFDRDRGMVAYATRRLQAWGRRGQARVFVADFIRFSHKVRTGSVDVAFNPINTIRHLESDSEMLEHFDQVKRVLRPGGIYILGVGLSWYGFETPTEDVWEGRERGLRVKQIIQFIPARNARERKEWAHSHLMIRKTRAGRSTEEHRDSSYSLRTYSNGQWRSLLRRSGLTLEQVVDERGRDTEPGPLGYALYVLRKPITRRSKSD